MNELINQIYELLNSKPEELIAFLTSNKEKILKLLKEQKSISDILEKLNVGEKKEEEPSSIADIMAKSNESEDK